MGGAGTGEVTEVRVTTGYHHQLPVLVHINGRVSLHGADQVPSLLCQAVAVGFRLGQVESLLSQVT